MLGKKVRDEDEVRAFLGKGAEFTGKLMFDGSVRIDGDFKGSIYGGGTLVIGEGAEIEADIHVDSAMISGKVQGKIEVKKQIRIFATGQVTGDLSTPVFAVEEGAFFEGVCHMLRNEAEIHTLSLEKTTAADQG